NFPYIETRHCSVLAWLSLSFGFGSLIRTSAAAAWFAASIFAGTERLDRPHESTHEFAIYLGCNRVHSNAFRREKFACIFEVVNASGLNAHLLKTCRGELVAVFTLFKGPG